jgi:hypothetical protein
LGQQVLLARPSIKGALLFQLLATTHAALHQALSDMDLAGPPLGGKDYPKTLGEWLTKVAGLIVSILAVSHGGPFWFDVLQRFMQLRATGVAPRATNQKKT